MLSNANVFHYTSEYINRENYILKSNYKVNKVIHELNEVMKHMYQNNYNKYENVKLN